MAAENKKANDLAHNILELLKVGSKIGVGGTLALGWSAFFFFSADKEERHAFIDQYILLKSISNTPAYPFFIIGCLVVTLVVVLIYYNRLIKLMQKEIDILSGIRTDKQQLSFPTKKLASTKKKK